MSKHPLRVAILGTAKRSDYLYGPLIKALPEDVELVSIWGRSSDLVERLGKSLGVPAYTDLDKLVGETAPEIGVVSVNYHANGEVGRMAVEAGLHVLLETPIAHKLSEADAIIEAAFASAPRATPARIGPARPWRSTSARTRSCVLSPHSARPTARKLVRSASMDSARPTAGATPALILIRPHVKAPRCAPYPGHGPIGLRPG